MTIKMRFEKKLPIPSTIEIKHELRLMEAADAAVASTSPKERDLIIDELTLMDSLPKDRFEMLVERLRGVRSQTSTSVVRATADMS